jgi:hypothetical protein
MAAHVGAKGRLRICCADFALAGILSTTPASSNPLDDLFSIAPRARAPTFPAQPECLARPGNSTPTASIGSIESDGRRECWFLAEGIATVKKPARSRVAKDPVANLDEDAIARGKRSPVVDARAELLRPRPAERSQPPVLNSK